ncbi:MAG: hypothetical protein IJN91_00865 [Alphaproteobacteria bacterium]|nr:hypothetical protein [Alphaproteobacteria bacterium]
MGQKIAFASVYNFEPTEDILDKSFNGYRILPFHLFKDKYKGLVQYLQESNNWLIEPTVPSIPLKYILILEGDENTDVHKLSFRQVLNMFSNTIMYARLFKHGDIQLGTIFIAEVGRQPIRHPYHTRFECFMSSVPYEGYTMYPDIYTINQDEMNDFLGFVKQIEDVPDKKIESFFEALYFFDLAKNYHDISSRILNYVIFFERLFLTGTQELKFRLRSYLVFLLKDPSLTDFIDIIYDMRSNVAHSGEAAPADYRRKHKKRHKQELTMAQLDEYINRLDNVARQAARKVLDMIISGTVVNLQDFITQNNKQFFECLAKK